MGKLQVLAETISYGQGQLGDRFYDNKEVVAIFKEYRDVLGDAVPRANNRGRAVMDELIWCLQPGDAKLIDAWSDANAGKVTSAGTAIYLDWMGLPRRVNSSRIPLIAAKKHFPSEEDGETTGTKERRLY